ncbi:MAG: glycosyltransferase [Cyanobacteria bacterium J06621_8]
MIHFGIICPPAYGHLNPMTALGHELKERGHRVTVISTAYAKSLAQAAGLEFQEIGSSYVYQSKDPAKQPGLSGIRAALYQIKEFAEEADMCLREAPEVVSRCHIEALLVDQASPEGGTVAEYLNIPFISIASAVLSNMDSSVPPSYISANYDPSWQGVLRNKIAYFAQNLVSKTITKSINAHRQRWSLPLHHHPNQRYSQLAQISQQPAEFEFPHQKLAQCFHFTGSFSNPSSRESVSFPYDKLTGQPLIYASMGTVTNGLYWIFKMIVAACTDLDAQLVIGLGGASADSLTKLPDNTIAVRYAPQLELLQRASLTITHAGLNTTLESLSYGVPMVAIPITADQPGSAARIAWTGSGVVIPLKKVSIAKLRKAITQVLTDDSYRQNALRLQANIKQGGGTSRAADIIEQAVSSNSPVLA